MKKREALKIIQEEQLRYYNFFESKDHAVDEMVIKKQFKKYIVYATDERASKITAGQAIFDHEEEALDNFIRRLRSLNKIKNR